MDIKGAGVGSAGAQTGRLHAPLHRRHSTIIYRTETRRHSLSACSEPAGRFFVLRQILLSRVSGKMVSSPSYLDF